MVYEDGKTYCIDPLQKTLQVISKRWAMLVVGVLGNEPEARFNQIKNTIPGITARALSDVLQELQRQDLVLRNVDTNGSPPHVHYRLTKKGKSMRRALIPLIQWAENP